MSRSREFYKHRFRLNLESLDQRNAPSGIETDPEPPLILASNPPPANTAPQIINFSAVAGIGGLWEFTGDVVDESPGGLTVTFGGEPESLQGVTVVTDANGHFSKIILLHTDGSDDGLATAQTADDQGLQSNVARYSIHPS